MKCLKLYIFLILVSSCKTSVNVETQKATKDITSEINLVLDNWHKAAAEADFDNYFKLMTNDGVFIGTDATENWKNEAFRVFSKPYFDRGKAWDFTSLERNIYVYNDKKIVWFDELLDTQMKLCRGSGIMKLENNQWKVAHYVLSITIPNENVPQVVKMKTKFDSIYTKTLLTR